MKPPSFTPLGKQIPVWLIRPELIVNPDTLSEYRLILSKSEKEQMDRFRFPADQHLYLVSHALVRHMLSGYLNIKPQDVQFDRSETGKPTIRVAQNPLNIQFNLTHTRGLAACVVSLDNVCGIDAEQIKQRNQDGIAKRMYSDTEYRELKTLTGQEYLEYFYTRWTLREAYVKARGLGMSFPTKNICFKNKDNHVSVDFETKLKQNSDHWQFTLLKPTDEHCLAVAIAVQNGTDHKIITSFVEP